MLSNYSSNVIISKVRSMYSKHMTSKDYNLLLNCKNIGELTGILKNHSASYADVLSDLNEKDVHRNQLESLIRRKKFKDSLSICRYELTVGAQFSRYIVKKTEIEQMLHTLRLILAKKSPTLIYTMPIFFSKYASVDFPSLTKVKSYEEFLIAIEKSDYKKILFEFKETFGKDTTILAKIEIKMYIYLYSYVYKIIEKRVLRGAKKELYDIFDSYIDFLNYSRIFRIKKYYNMSSENLYNLVLPFGTLKKNKIKEMVNASDYKEVTNIMKATSSGKVLSNLEFNYTDEIPYRVAFKVCSRYIRFSSNPSVVMFCYVDLLNIELSNIVNIIEGIRYKIPAKNIAKFLIFNKI